MGKTRWMTQYIAVKNIMANGAPITLFRLKERVEQVLSENRGVPIWVSETSVSARIRDLRKHGYAVKSVPGETAGTWLYQIVDWPPYPVVEVE